LKRSDHQFLTSTTPFTPVYWMKMSVQLHRLTDWLTPWSFTIQSRQPVSILFDSFAMRIKIIISFIMREALGMTNSKAMRRPH
jgi:hypothetical protein